MRRLFNRCTEPLNVATWNGDTDNRFNGEWTFGQPKKCDKMVDVLYDMEYTEDNDYWPLLRDAFGRLTPGGNKQEMLSCGHISAKLIKTREDRERERHPRLWKKLLPIQKKAIIDIENNDLSGYCCYDTGVGKTVIAASLVRENWEEMLPALVVTEAGDIHRFSKEFEKYGGAGDLMKAGKLREAMKFIPQVINKKTTGAAIGDIIIVSWTNLMNEDFMEWVFARGFKSIISDESHMFKNEESKRTQGFIKACSKIKNRIFLSATWIENKIEEAFVPLNILDTNHFPRRASLLRYCIFSSSGKTYSLDPYYRNAFLDTIKPYVFRVTKDEAGIKFPHKWSKTVGNRQPIWYDPQEYKANIGMMSEYNAQLDELERALHSHELSYGTIIGLMSSLRHLTGRMKVAMAAEHVGFFLMNNPGEKLCVGVHHKSVMDGLVKYLNLLGINCLTMSSEIPEKKDAIEMKWKEQPEYPVLIASTLGAGKGRNFQFCKNAILLERMWNQNKELQFEGRFQRITVDENDNVRTEFTSADDVTIDYIMAKDTIDEYFDALVDLKGAIVDSADSSVEEALSRDAVMDLARRMIGKRLQHVEGKMYN